jgi:hypothetical protein
MKPTSFLILAIPLFMVACKPKCIEDSGKHITKDVSLKVFDEIKVSGPLKLVLRQDSSYTLQLSADSNLVDQIKTEVSGGEFKVSLDPKVYCGSDSVVVHVGIGELKKLAADKNSQVFGEGMIYVNKLDIDLHDTTSVNLSLNAAVLSTSLDGKTQLTLSGQTGKHELESKGSLVLNAFDFVSGMYDLDIEGLGRSNINVLNELKVKTSGSSEIYYKGSPKSVNEKKNGVSKLEKVN